MFFKKTSLGIDISDYSIELISLGGPIENPRLLALARVVLEPGIFEAGRILKKDDLKIRLEDLVKHPKFGKIKSKKAIFAIPESQSFIQNFKIPEEISKIEALEYVKSRARESFPYKLEDLYFDYQPPTSTGGGEILLVAVPKEIVNDYSAALKGCQLQPIAAEIESISLARALLLGKEEPTLIADIGARTTNLNVFEKGKLKLSFSLPVAGNQLTKAISEKLNISFEEAEKEKLEVGLNPKPKEGKIFLILQKELQEIINEIRRIEDYFENKTGKSIVKIILAGGSAVLPRLPEYLSENLEKPVEIGDPWQKINIDILKKKEYFKEALEINPILYSTCIGSALRGLEKDPEKSGINLLKKDN